MELQELLSRTVLRAFAQQMHLMDLIGERDWSFDCSTGVLSFGQDLHWQAEILGTESYDSDTWLWAWANAGSNLPLALTQASRHLRRLGEEQRIAALMEPKWPLADNLDGHTMAIVASGLGEGSAYYCGPHDAGATFLLISDPKYPQSTAAPLARLSQVFVQAISNVEIANHRLALTSYLDHFKIPCESEGDAVVVKEGGQRVLTAVFDRQSRLIQFEAAQP